MPRVSDKRDRLINAARDLMHRHGYARTSLADIAQASGVALGNVYYYFKTKEDIVSAIIDDYIAHARSLTEEWQGRLTPRERLLAYLEVPLENCEALKSHGCPMGSLAQELSKDAPELKARADAMLKAQLQWLARQFQELGYADSEVLARSVVATVQGSSLLANALGDDAVVREQVARLKEWVAGL